MATKNKTRMDIAHIIPAFIWMCWLANLQYTIGYNDTWDDLYDSPEADEGDLRLVGKIPDNVTLPADYDVSYGRVEIYHDRKWGTICDADWGEDDAEVVCRQLGFPGAVSAHDNAYYGEGNGSIVLGDVRCHGYEERLDECDHDPWTQHSCEHSDDVGVFCFKPAISDDGDDSRNEGDIRLVNLSPDYDPSYGRVEIYHDWKWNAICDADWGAEEADVVCKQLGFAGGIPLDDVYYNSDGSESIITVDVRCQGNEKRLDQCEQDPGTQHSCANSDGELGGAICIDLDIWHGEYNSSETDRGVEYHSPKVAYEGDIRLVGKSPGDGTLPADYDAYYGRVEIYHDRKWGSICDADWGLDDAEVVCRQLGFPGTVSAHGNAYYGEGSESILLGDVRCRGNEERLDECEHDPWNQHSCEHSDDVGVICVEPDLYYPRLVGTFDILEVWDGSRWRRMCSTLFAEEEAATACKQLGFVDFVLGYLDFHDGEDDTPPLNLRFSCSTLDDKLSDCRTATIDTSDCGNVALDCESFFFWTSPYAFILYVVVLNVVGITLGVYLKRRRKRRRFRRVTTVRVVRVESATAAQPDVTPPGNVPYERFE